MIPVTAFASRSVGVFGLARSGVAAAHALQAGGARVLVWDDSAARRSVAAGSGLTVMDWRDPRWNDVSALILAPGVPLTHPAPHDIVVWADSRNIPVIGDIELLIGEVRSRARIIGITGTNGKSTTTAIVGHLLRNAGKPAEVGGNIGIPVLDLNPVSPGGTYVLEVSSYQIDLTPSWRADTAILLNTTPDHLDRHGTMERYAAIKRRIFGAQGKGATAIIGVDDDYGRATLRLLEQEGTGRAIVPVSVERQLAEGICIIDGLLRENGATRFDVRELANLPGRHNWQNIGCAWAAARAEGLDTEAIVAGLRSFPGLAHRMERVGEINGIAFINDSKATNAEAAEKALLCFDAIHWIAGGKAKDGGIEALRPHFGRIAHAYLIGEAASDFAATLDGAIPFTMSGDLETATRQAFAAAKQGGVVLLSPACASFDQFADFEQRGQRFRAIVQTISAEVAEHHHTGAAA